MKIINVSTKEENVDEEITLCVKGEDRQIQVLRSVLISSSGYFHHEFSFEAEDHGSVFVFEKEEIPSISILKLIVEYMESKVLVPADWSIEGLFCAADFLQMNSLILVLFAYLQGELKKHAEKPWEVERGDVLRYLRLMNVTTRNDLLAVSLAANSKVTIRYCVGGLLQTDELENCPEFYIGYHFKSIMFERPLVELSYRSLYRLLLEDSLRIPEEDVVRAIKMWINHDYNARISHYAYLLRCVRFVPEMKLSFLLDEILGYSDTAKDYVIAIFALRNGYDYNSHSGPLKEYRRPYCDCHL